MRLRCVQLIQAQPGGGSLPHSPPQQTNLPQIQHQDVHTCEHIWHALTMSTIASKWRIGLHCKCSPRCTVTSTQDKVWWDDTYIDLTDSQPLTSHRVGPAPTPVHEDCCQQKQVRQGKQGWPGKSCQAQGHCACNPCIAITCRAHHN